LLLVKLQQFVAGGFSISTAASAQNYEGNSWQGRVSPEFVTRKSVQIVSAFKILNGNVRINAATVFQLANSKGFRDHQTEMKDDC